MNSFVQPLLRLVAWAPHWFDRVYPRPLGRRYWLRLRSAALARHPIDFETVLSPEGVRYAGSTADVIQRSVYLYGVWEPDITAWVRTFLRTGDTAIDVGANTGYYSTLFGNLVGTGGTVLAFEPVPSIFDELVENLRRNHLTQVVARKAALGSADGQIEVFRASSGNVGNSSTRWEQGHSSEGMVDVRIADEALKPVATRIRLMKIDTEGDEIEVLRGMTQTMDSMPAGAAILVEVTPDKLRLRGQTARELWNLFARSGWTPHIIRNDYDFDRYGTAAGATSSRLEPVLQLPESRVDMVFVKPDLCERLSQV